MVQWANQLRAAGMRTGLLSNMPITLRHHIQRECRWLPPFDHSCYSCDVREVKPDPAIYEEALQGLGAAPEEVLFLDDREENIEAARSLGLHALRFRTAEQAQSEIEQRYQLPVPIR